MKDLLGITKAEGPAKVLPSVASLFADSLEFRALLRKSVVVLSSLIAVSFTVNAIKRGEDHFLVCGVLTAVCLTAAILVSRVPEGSKHLMTSVNALMILLVAAICFQVVHGGVSAILVWTLPFFLIWVSFLPTLPVVLAGVICSFLTVSLAPAHTVIPENLLLALASILVVHFGKQQVRKQMELSESDPLTGALNRRYLINELDKLRANYIRNSRETSLVLIDIDGLKQINDTFGHLKGDAVLKTLVLVINQRIRGTDSLFRIGGDEFALILYDAGAHASVSVANELRRLVKDAAPETLPSYGISFGVCSVKESVSAEDWIDKADLALYRAKASGGDSVELAE